MSSWPISRVRPWLCSAAAAERVLLVAGIEDDEAALLHEGIDLGERRVRQRLGVFRHRPIEDREEGQVVVVDVDAHRLAGLERGARGEHLAQSGQALAARLVDLRIAGDDISEMGLERSVEVEVLAARCRVRRLLRLGLGRGVRHGNEGERKEHGRRGWSAAPEAEARAQQDHGENIDGEQRQARRDRARARAAPVCAGHRR